MPSFCETAAQIIRWAEERELIPEEISPQAALIQLRKTQEELAELTDELSEMVANPTEAVRLKAALELGDVFVTLIIAGHIVDIGASDALNAAFNKIKSRTGQTVNGLFIKDEDLINQ